MTASTSAIDEQVAVGDQHLGRAVRLLDDFIGARRPADAAVQARLRAAELVLVRVAGDERVFVEHQAELAGGGSRIEIAQHCDRHAGFLREIANEELALVELRGGEHLAGELIDRGDAAIDDDHVGAARVADLHRHDGVELPAEHGERVGRRRGGGEPAVVERRPGFALALRDLHLEAVFLREERVGIRLEAAVRDDQAAVAGVFADVDLQHVVFRRVGRGGFQRRRAVDRLDRRRRIAVRLRPWRERVGRVARASQPSAAPSRLLPSHRYSAQADEAEQQQQRDEVAGGRAARSMTASKCSATHESSPHSETFTRRFAAARRLDFGSQQVGGRRLVGQVFEAREQLALILQPAIRFVERRRQRVERRARRCARRWRAAPARAPATPAGAAVRVSASTSSRRRSASAWPLRARGSLRAAVRGCACSSSSTSSWLRRSMSASLLLFEIAALAPGRGDDLQDRRARGEQLQMQPRHLPHVAHLRFGRAGARQQIDDLARLRARSSPAGRAPSCRAATSQLRVARMPVGLAVPRRRRSRGKRGLRDSAHRYRPSSPAPISQKRRD